MSSNQILASIEQNISGYKFRGKIELYEDRLVWNWNQGKNSGHQAFGIESLAPELGYQSGMRSDFKEKIAKGLVVFVCGLVLTVFNSTLGIQIFGGIVALIGIYFLVQAFQLSLYDEWLIVNSDNGNQITWISYQDSSPEDRERFQHEYKKLMERIR